MDGQHRTHGEDMAALRAFIESGFININERLDAIVVQTTATNGRLRTVESTTAVHTSQITELKDDSKASRNRLDIAKMPITWTTGTTVILAIIGIVAVTVQVMERIGWHRVPGQ